MGFEWIIKDSKHVSLIEPCDWQPANYDFCHVVDSIIMLALQQIPVVINSLVNIGSFNGLVPLGNSTLHEPMLRQAYVNIWCH